MGLRTALFCCTLAMPAAAADVAMVGDEVGQSILVSHRGLCYAILPDHVSPRNDRIALAVSLPAMEGAAEIFHRVPEEDIAIAYVEGDIAARCSVQWVDLLGDLSDTLQSAETGLIKSVHFDGRFFDRLSAKLVDVDDRLITVELTEGAIDADVAEGMSGSMLTVKGEIAGLALEAGSAIEAHFLRMDRIAALLGPALSGANHPSNRAIDGDFRVTSFSGGDRTGVLNLEGAELSEPWVADWTGEPIEFEITLSNDALVLVNRVEMTTNVGQGATPPRRMAIQIDRGLPGNAYWTPLFVPDMSPTGVFEMQTGGTVGRRIKIRIEDVWFPDRRLRLDSLSVR